MDQVILVTVGSLATLLFLGGTAVQVIGLLINLLATTLQVTRPSLSKQGRAEARGLLLGGVVTLAVSPLVGLAVNQASYWLQHNEPLLGLLLTIGVIFVLLVGGSLAVSAVTRVNDDDVGTWSSLARDIHDAIHTDNAEPALLRQHEARQNQLLAANSAVRSDSVVPQDHIDRTARRLQLDTRNRPLVAGLTPFAAAVKALLTWHTSSHGRCRHSAHLRLA